MSFETHRQHIEDRFNTNFATGTTPVQYDNVDFLISGSSTLADNKGLDEWCRLTIIPGETTNQTVGATRQRSVGVIIVQVFTKTGTGSDRARAIADSIKTVFENKSFNGVRTHATSISRIGDSDGYLQINVSTPFYVDAT